MSIALLQFHWSTHRFNSVNVQELVFVTSTATCTDIRWDIKYCIWNLCRLSAIFRITLRLLQLTQQKLLLLKAQAWIQSTTELFMLNWKGAFKCHTEWQTQSKSDGKRTFFCEVTNILCFIQLLGESDESFFPLPHLGTENFTDHWVQAIHHLCTASHLR